MNKQIAAMVLAGAAPAVHASLPDLAGTWTLVAADVQRPDGSIERDYGAAPKGRLCIDAQGRYTLQIFKAERPRFASPDKAAGTGDEFRAAVLGSSTHYGTVAMDGGQLVFHIEAASFPNWEGTVQRRSFELHGDELRYRVPARPDGGIPISVWRRMP
ncbi:lipocalin-like domain-containing protein [Massilia putida]|uniref:lipocalin-like domain-containing protein n=1 Tax=Massilia putida TaxID=1141883 RepID=UPI0009525B50|nr:lipocalin-like domain-containing protein [Massilia putida]